MENRSSMTSWLDHLAVLVPPRHLVLVGAGSGTGELTRWLIRAELPSVTLLEADEGRAALLQRATAHFAGWRVRKQVVSDRTSSATFHEASVTSESGLIDPERLRSHWPNIQTRAKQVRQATSLADALQDDPVPAHWLLVDCLPTLPILRGAADQLDHVDVLVVRWMEHGPDQDHNQPASEAGAWLPWLEEKGLRRIASETGRHPAMGHALFVRDTAQQLRKEHASVFEREAARHANELQLARDESKAERERLQAALNAAVHESQSIAALHKAAQLQCQKMEKQIKELEQLAHNCNAEKMRLSESLNARTKSLEDMRKQVENAAEMHADLQQTNKHLKLEMTRMKTLLTLIEGLQSDRLV